MKKFVYISLILLSALGYHQSSLVAPSAITVFAGHDRTMCLSQNLLITDLQATITGDVNNGDWLTYGDGRFQPGNLLTVRYSTAQANQITYVPGPNDRALGYYRLLLMSDAPTNNPQERATDEVRINFQTAPPLFCSNNINISLNESCSQKVDATMLQPNPVQPYSNYIITLYNPSGNIITGNILTKDHIDQEITFKLGHQCTSNICWGKFKVEDYFPPVFVCKNDTIPCTKSFAPDSLGFPVPMGAYVDTLINGKYIVKNWDACSDVSLDYTDTTIKAECARDEDKTISRRWKASDAKGNTSYCTELIVVKRMSHNQVVFPPNFEGHEKPAFECGDVFPKLANGHPSPDTTGYPIIGHCGNLQMNMSDITFPLCGNSYKIARSWFVIDWCTALSVTKNQIIAIKDTNSPFIVCQDTINLDAGAYQCAAAKTPIPALIQVSDCSAYNVEYKLFQPNGAEVTQYIVSNTQGTFIEGLPVGTYYLQYIVTDVCQNQGICESTIIVKDTSPPYPACDGLTKVALDANGKGRIFASTFDDGSTDNCGIASFKARKMTDQCGFGLQFGDFLDFCCAELGQTIMVALEVTDIYGNKNTCMVEVIVEDKLKPSLTCPPDITLSCTDNYDLAQLNIFGTVVTDPSKIKDIVVNNFYHNGNVGKDGLAKDNCSVTVTSKYRTEIACHTGFIYRTFTATDANGLKDSCTQKITILNPDPFDETNIKWPQNYTGSGCKLNQTNPDLTGKPTFNNTNCGNIAATYEDTPFFASDSACLKIFRIWTVIDWCQFNQSNSSGKWGPYTQIIKLHNSDKPVFTTSCTDTTFCSYDNMCEKGFVEISANAEDPCTESENLLWNYTIDIHQNGSIDISGNANKYAGDIPLGSHTITWTVSDPCGNSEKCTRNFVVEDCKKPTPYCISSLTFPLDQIKGSAEIWAKDFDNGSFDNCTPKSELIFTFDGYTPVQSIIQQEHFFKGNGLLSNRQEYENGLAQKWIPTTLSSGIYVDCDDISNGIADTLILNMTVTDIKGNQDFCQINLIIQDNHNHCVDIIQFASISGQIKTEYNKIPKNVEVNYHATEIDEIVIADNTNGLYQIENIALGKGYKILPSLNDSVMQGITTLDLVLIQRHILGIKPLDSPYKIIASDVNGSKSITAADLVEIRKLILGVTDKFPKNIPSWVFVAKEDGITDPTFPYNYKNHIETEALENDLQGQDFIAVKMGDVNESAFNVGTSHTESRNLNNDKPFKLLTSIEKIDGHNYLTFRSSEDIDLDAMQLFLQQDGNMDIIDVNRLKPNHTMEHDIHLKENNISFILYSSQSQPIKKGELLYSLALKSENDLNNLSILSNKQSEVYIGDDSRSIQLVKNVNTNDKFFINIITNPVADDLRLNISNVTDEQKLLCTITNIEGKVVHNSTIDLSKENTEYRINLPDNILPGLYFLNISHGDYQETLKFIRIK